uniref:Adenylate kinase n=1 Tax=Mycena chlorophos TaxID=658473 RepID=A0ABQ0LN32_MYCCL|nr:predicted protein [Mycena chlorophos]
MELPPLLGDGDGVYRVHLVGNAGAGKSTVGREVAKILGVPYLCLDELFWKPGWGQETHEQFRLNVENALAASPNGWVVDGNYSRRIGDMVVDPSTDEIWLDPPLALYLPRIAIRTFARLFGLAEPCRPGCEETIDVFFSRENMILWCFQNHGRVRHRESSRFEKIGLGVGTDAENRKMRRLGGWGSEVSAWLNKVREWARA